MLFNSFVDNWKLLKGNVFIYLCFFLNVVFTHLQNLGDYEKLYIAKMHDSESGLPYATEIL